jgi:hypothetical protein
MISFRPGPDPTEGRGRSKGTRWVAAALAATVISGAALAALVVKVLKVDLGRVRKEAAT